MLPASTQSRFAAGSRLFDDRFVLRRRLGSEAEIETWLADDTKYDQAVVLKFAPPAIASDPVASLRLKEAARAALSLSHESIVRTFDFLTAGEGFAIATEYIDGSAAGGQRTQNPNEVTRWARQVSSALRYAHAEKRLVHGRIHAGNLIVDDKGNLRVADFVVSHRLRRCVEQLRAGTNGNGGTLRLSHDEPAGDRPTTADDVLGFGATFLGLLTGQPRTAFEPDARLARAKTEAIEEILRERGAPTWTAMLVDCVREDPAQRPSWQDIAAALAASDRSTAREESSPLAIVTIEPPANSRAGRRAAARPSPAARPRWRPHPLLWGTAALALGGAAAFWFGDGPNRYRAWEAHKIVPTAILAHDWTRAMTALRVTLGYRPTDIEYQSEYESAQTMWFKDLSRDLEPLTAEAARSKLLGAPQKESELLGAPMRQQFDRLVADTTARVVQNVRQGLVRAERLATERKFADAYSAIDNVRANAELVPEFAAKVDGVRAAEVRDAIVRAHGAAARNEFAEAYAALEGVKESAALVPDYPDAKRKVQEAEVRFNLGRAKARADAGDFLGALGAVFAEYKKKLLPQEVEAVRVAIQNKGKAAEIAKLTRALLDRDLPTAQAAMNDYAALTDTKLSIDAQALFAERDLNRFLGALEELHLRPAKGELRRNHDDQILVAMLRRRFADSSQVRAFLAASYAEWARELNGNGFPGFALYLSNQAAQEGAEPDIPLRSAALAALAKEFSLAIHLLPVEGDALLGEPASNALQAALTDSVGKWIAISAGNPSGETAARILVHLRLGEIATADTPSTETRYAHYQSGTTTRQNPAYAELARRVEQANAEAAQAEALNASNQAQAQANMANNALGQFGAAANAILASGSSVANLEIQRRATNLRNQLANTAPTIEVPAYADEEYQVITHNVMYSVEALSAVDWKGKAMSNPVKHVATYHATVSEVTGNPDHNVPVRSPDYPDPGKVHAELASALAAQMGADTQGLLGTLGEASFLVLEQQLANSRALPDVVSDRRWGLIELWLNSGVRVNGTEPWQQAVRTALGLVAAN